MAQCNPKGSYNGDLGGSKSAKREAITEAEVSDGLGKGRKGPRAKEWKWCLEKSRTQTFLCELQEERSLANHFGLEDDRGALFSSTPFVVIGCSSNGKGMRQLMMSSGTQSRVNSACESWGRRKEAKSTHEGVKVRCPGLESWQGRRATSRARAHGSYSVHPTPLVRSLGIIAAFA